jgi:photosystem II stability/assembly factor-like uncharacterized protein
MAMGIGEKSPIAQPGVPAYAVTTPTRNHLRRVSLFALGLIVAILAPTYVAWAQPTSAPTQETIISAWADFTAGILEPGILAILPDPSAKLGVWAAARGVLYFSTDGGDTWALVGRFRDRVGRNQNQGDGEDEGDDPDDAEEQIREDAAQELADELGVDAIDLLDDPNNVDFDQLVEDRQDEADFAKDEEDALTEVVQRIRSDLPRAIAVAKENPQVVFVASTNGLYRSLERGADLRRLLLPKDPDVVTVAVNPTGEIVLVGTSRGLLRSEDGGSTWQSSNEPGLQKGKVVAADVDFLKQERILVLTKQSIFYSQDTGKTFSATASTPPGRLRDVSLDPSRPKVFFAASDQGLFISLDEGNSWDPSITFPEPLRQIGVRRVEVSPTKSGQVFIAAANGEVYLSEDGGARFTDTGEGLPALGLSALEIDPTEPGIIWATTGEGVYRYGLVRAGEISEREQKRLLEGFRSEPSAAEVVLAAIKVAGLDKGYDRIKRIKLAPYMPLLRLQLTIDKQRSQSVDLAAGAPSTAQEVNQERANFSALAVWDIARYYGIGGQLARFERTRDKKRARLEARIVKLYEERRAIQLSLLRRPPASAKGFMKAELRLEELTALLDSISAGYFTEARAKKQKENGAPK